MDKDSQFFTKRAWACGLTMGSGKQRGVEERYRKATDLANNFFGLRKHHLRNCPLQHQCMGEVIDILRCTGEVNPFGQIFKR